MTTINKLKIRKHSIVITDNRSRSDMAESTKINNILNRYNNAGVDFFANKYVNIDLDSDVLNIDLCQDLHSVNNRLIELQSSFINNIPAKIRREFNNDPIEMIKFLQNEKNHDQAVQMGLLKPKIIEKNEVVDEKKDSTENK
jgi:hypothetical protein